MESESESVNADIYESWVERFNENRTPSIKEPSD